jgi:hypothetical protein
MLDIAIPEHELQQVYRSTETDELVDRVRRKTLTSHAHSLALQELSSRGVQVDGLPPGPASQADLHRIAARPFLTRCWYGEEPLWKAFWVIGVVRGIALAFVLAFVGTEHGGLALLLAYLLVGLPAEIVWIVSVWRCGFRNPTPWNLPAALAVVLITGWVLLMLASGVVLC